MRNLKLFDKTYFAKFIFLDKIGLEGFMSIFEVLFIAIGLSMDAFAVSICLGLSSGNSSDFKKMFLPGIYFGLFQALMPVFGYFLGKRFLTFISNYDHWAAFILLGLIGANMIKESRECPDDAAKTDFKHKTLLVLAVATSIDAFAVGLTFGFLNVNILFCAIMIGLVTFLFSILGFWAGKVFSSKYKSSAELFGGVILILIGLKVLLEHILG